MTLLVIVIVETLEAITDIPQLCSRRPATDRTAVDSSQQKSSERKTKNFSFSLAIDVP